MPWPRRASTFVAVAFVVATVVLVLVVDGAGVVVLLAVVVVVEFALARLLWRGRMVVPMLMSPRAHWPRKRHATTGAIGTTGCGSGARRTGGSRAMADNDGGCGGMGEARGPFAGDIIGWRLLLLTLAS